MMRYLTVTNVRTSDLEKVLNTHAKNGWTMDRVVSVVGDIGSTFTVIFKRDDY